MDQSNLKARKTVPKSRAHHEKTRARTEQVAETQTNPGGEILSENVASNQPTVSGNDSIHNYSPKKPDKLTSIKPSGKRRKSPEPSKVGNNSQPRSRKNGIVQEALYLKSKPSSSTRKENNPKDRPSSTLKTAKRRVGHAGQSKDGEERKGENRREALCSTTDMYADQRRVARIVRKKF